MTSTLSASSNTTPSSGSSSSGVGASDCSSHPSTPTQMSIALSSTFSLDSAFDHELERAIDEGRTTELVLVSIIQPKFRHSQFTVGVHRTWIVLRSVLGRENSCSRQRQSKRPYRHSLLGQCCRIDRPCSSTHISTLPSTNSDSRSSNSILVGCFNSMCVSLSLSLSLSLSFFLSSLYLLDFSFLLE